MEKSPLSKLPPELRNIIYEHIVVNNDKIKVRDFYAGKRTSVAKPPSILHACRQIRGEASPLYYGLNTFDMQSYEGNDKMLCRWLAGLEAQDRSHLREIRLDDTWYEEDQVQARIQRCRRISVSRACR